MEDNKKYHVWLQSDKGEGICVLLNTYDNVEEITIPTWIFKDVLIKITYENL